MPALIATVGGTVCGLALRKPYQVAASLGIHLVLGWASLGVLQTNHDHKYTPEQCQLLKEFGREVPTITTRDRVRCIVCGPLSLTTEAQGHYYIYKFRPKTDKVKESE